MGKKTVSRIDPVSLGKWTAAFSLIVAGLAILMYLPFLLAGLFFSEIAATGLIAAIIGGVILVLFSVGLYAVFGFFMGFVTAYVYNGFATRFGGIELELEDLQTE